MLKNIINLFVKGGKFVGLNLVAESFRTGIGEVLKGEVSGAVNYLKANIFGFGFADEKLFLQAYTLAYFILIKEIKMARHSRKKPTESELETIYKEANNLVAKVAKAINSIFPDAVDRDRLGKALGFTAEDLPQEIQTFTGWKTGNIVGAVIFARWSKIKETDLEEELKSIDVGDSAERTIMLAIKAFKNIIRSAIGQPNLDKLNTFVEDEIVKAERKNQLLKAKLKKQEKWKKL